MEEVSTLKQLQEQCLTFGLNTNEIKQKLKERIEKSYTI